MSKLTTAINLIKKNKGVFFATLLKKINFVFPDKLYLQLMYRCRTGLKLDLKNPRNFNEKLQWLKLYNRNSLYTTLVDKYAVKGYVSKKIGEQYVIPTLATWNNADEIDFDLLPNQFVLKTTHGSGGDVIICKDKTKFDKEKAVDHLKKSMIKNVYSVLREWPYKNVTKRIIAEKYMEDESGELRDFKVLCFDGVPKMIEYHQGRFKTHTQDFYDENWNLLSIYQGSPLSGKAIEKPVFFDEMMSLSAILSKGIPHVRVDWYFVQNQLYFGEMTFFDASGFENFEPEEYNRILGNWIKLPNI